MSKSLWLLSAGFAAITAAPAYAQDNTQPTGETSVLQDAAEVDAQADTQPTDESYGGDIVITAQGRAQALQDVPLAVSAVSAESLQNSGATDIRQLNQLAPSLLVSSTGSESNGSARIRGIGTVGDNPGLESSVAVFIDGVYRSRTGVGLNELGEIERVEVLRGPQGTLFGRNASAGLLNIISKKPNLDEFEAFGELTYGNYDFMRANLGVTGPIGETLGFRIDGVYAKRDGFLRVDRPTGGTESRVNDRDRLFLRGQLLFEPNENIEVRLIGDYTTRDESCCAAVYLSTRETVGAPTTPGGFTVAPSNRIVDILRHPFFGETFPSGNDPYNRIASVTPGRTYRNDTKDWGLSGQVDWTLGAATLTSITAYREYEAGGAADIDYGRADIAYRADDGNAFRKFETFTQELRLQGSAFADKLDWLVGAYYAKEDLQVADNTKFGTQYGAFAACRIVSNISPVAALRNPANPGCLSPAGTATINSVFGPSLAPAVIRGLNNLSTINNVGDLRANYFQDSENYAFFTHNIFNITDRLALTLGARYTNETKKFSADFNNNNAMCPTQQAQILPLLASAAVPQSAKTLLGGILTLSCQGNSSTTLNGLNLEDERNEDEWTGTGVLSYKPNDDLLLYASYSKGYKAGGFNLDRSALGTAPVGANPTFTPTNNGDVADLQFEAEKVDAYELGAKFGNRNLTLNVALFRQLFKDFQLNTFNGSVFIVQNINACRDALTGGVDNDASPTGNCTGKQRAGVRTQGVEVEAALFPHPDLTITAGYTFADTKFRRNLTGANGVPLDPALFLLSGDNMSNAPEHVVTTSLTWTPPIGGSGLTGLVYVDGRLASDYNTGSDLAPEKEQDGFFLMNARVGIRGPGQRWGLELWAQNLFDVGYTQVGFNAPFQGAGSVANAIAFGGTANQIYSAFLAEPRTYGVTGRFRF